MLKEKELWLVLEPAEDIPGQWTGHCLDLDIVSQGASLQHALQMTFEAVLLTVADDLEAARDPFARRSAPDQDWEHLTKILREGHRGALPESTASVVVATQMRLSVRMDSAASEPLVQQIAPAWLIEPTEAAAHSSPN